jgi:hypothetical protein
MSDSKAMSEREAWDGDCRESRVAFRNYDSIAEPARGKTPWQIWRDACAWQARASLAASAGKAECAYALIGRQLISSGLYDRMADADSNDEAAGLISELVSVVDPILNTKYERHNAAPTPAAAQTIGGSRASAGTQPVVTVTAQVMAQIAELEIARPDRVEGES